MKKFSAILCTIVLALTAAGLVACGDKENKPSEEQTYTVTFDYNYDGAPAAKTQTVKSGESAVKPEDPARQGYMFGGWYLYGARYDFSPVTADQTVEAMWRDPSYVVDPETPTHSVYFEALEGVTYKFGGAQPTAIADGETLRFAIEVSPYYVGTPVVKANGDTLTKDEFGAYNVVVRESQTVTVEGIERDTSRMTIRNGRYVISSPLQWVEFARKCNEFNGFYNLQYELDADLDFRGETIPMVEQFAGRFYGNGHTISNFTISVRETVDATTSGMTAVGLFSFLQAAIVHDLHVRDFHYGVVSNGSVSIGGIAGFSASADILGCSAEGKIEFENTYGYYASIGGIVGYMRGALAGYSGTVQSCRTNVETRVDSTGIVGGIVGTMTGDSAQAPVYVIGCAASGNLTGGTVGGIVGGIELYGAVADCYFTGTMTADTSEFTSEPATVGGIAGNCSPYEASIQNCFASFTGDAIASNADLAHRGEIFGNATLRQTDGMTAYAVFSILEDCYAVRGNTFISYDDDATVTAVTDLDALIELLGWSQDRWAAGEDIYPAPVYVEGEAFAFSVKFPGYEIARADGNGNFAGEIPLENEDGAPVTLPYTPVSFLLGNDGMAVYEDANSEATLSCGYFSAADETAVGLPAAYLVRGADTSVYIGFSDYTEIAGTYYFLGGSGQYLDRYALTLGSGDYFTASFAYGAFIQTTSFIYVAPQGRIIFLGCPASLGSAADGSVAIGGILLTTYTSTGTSQQYACFTENPYIGTWYTNDVTYYFDAAHYGYIHEKADSTFFTYSVTETGVNIYYNKEIGEIPFTYAEGKLTGDGRSLDRYDMFRGDYESLAYDLHAVSFDGAGKAYIDGSDTALNYTLNPGGTEATVTLESGETEVYTRDEYGTLTCVRGGVEYSYGGAYSYAGIWKVLPVNETSAQYANYRLTLYGIDDTGTGYATDSLGNVFVYTHVRMDGMDALALTAQDSVFAYVVMLVDEESGIEQPILVRTNNDGKLLHLPLGLDDPFTGTWYTPGDPTNTFTFDWHVPDEPTDAYPFGYASVKAGKDGKPIAYSYIGDMNTLTFTIGTDTHTAEYVSENEILIDGVKYIWRDEFARYIISDEEGTCVLLFNGESALGSGKVQVVAAGSQAVLPYTVDGNTATVTLNDEQKSPFMTVTYDPATGLYTAILDESVYKEPTPVEKRTYVCGMYNDFTGHWSVFDASALTEGVTGVEIGILSENYTGTAKVSHAGADMPLTMQIAPRIAGGEVVGLILTADETVYTLAASGTRLALTTYTGTVALYETDDMAGVWSRTEEWDSQGRPIPVPGDTLVFDGTAGVFIGAQVDTENVLLGAVRYGRQQLYYGWAVLGSGNDSAVTPALYLNIGGTPRLYAYAIPSTLSQITEHQKTFASLNPQVYFKTLPDGSRMYMLVAYPYCDALTGRDAITDDDALLYFTGNSLQNDVRVGWGFNYLTIADDAAGRNGAYMYEIREVRDDTVLIYMYDMSTYGRSTFMPSYVLTLTLDDADEIVSAHIDEYDDSVLLKDVWAA